MKHYFSKNFIKIFSIALIVILIQFGTLFVWYLHGQNGWKDDIYENFSTTVYSWLENRQPAFFNWIDIQNYLYTVSDNRVSGVIVTDSNENLIFAYSMKSFGLAKTESTAQYVTSNFRNIRYDIDDGITTSKNRIKKTIPIPRSVKANDIVGSITISSSKQTANLYLMCFSPRTYEYSKDIINSCLTSVVISIPLCIIFALISAFVISRKVTSHIDSIRNSLNELSLGKYEIETVKYKEEDLNQISLAIDKLSESLKRNSISQKVWLASISHDLNTPISAIKMLSEGMLDGVIPKNKETIEKLCNEIVNLEERVERVVEFSTLQTYKNLKISEIAVESLANELLEKYPIIKIESEIDKFKADKKLITKACFELLDNAHKFGDKVSISFNRNDKYYTIEVQNNGKLPSGISNSVLSEPWTRGEYGRNSSGNGLGLAIVSSIAELHGGNVSIVQKSRNKVSVVIQILAI